MADSRDTLYGLHGSLQSALNEDNPEFREFKEFEKALSALEGGLGAKSPDYRLFLAFLYGKEVAQQKPP